MTDFLYLIKRFFLEPLVLLGELKMLLKFRSQSEYDSIFFAVRPFQETFMRSISEHLPPEVKVAFVREQGKGKVDGPWERPPQGVDVYYICRPLTKFLKAKSFLTPEYSPTTRLLPKTPYHIHIPHSPVSLHMIYPENAFEGFNVFFGVGKHHEEEVKAMDDKNRRSYRPVYQVGYGRLDHLKKEHDNHQNQFDVGDKKLIVIAPSWHEGNILEEVGPKFSKTLLEEGYAVAFRPHYKIEENKKAFIERLREELNSEPFFFLQTAGADNSTLYEADLMISDFSGVAFEFAFLREKPVLFLDVPPKKRNPNWRELSTEPVELKLREELGALTSVEKNAMSQKVQELLEKQEHFASRIAEIRKQYCYNFESGAGKAGANCLKELIRENRT